MLTFKHAMNGKNETFTLVNSVKNHFLLFSGIQEAPPLLDGARITGQWALPFYTRIQSKTRVRALFQPKEEGARAIS